MIYKFKSLADVNIITDKLPSCVVSEVKRIAAILDDNYNCYGIDGGYILVGENFSDISNIKCNYFDYTSEHIECYTELGDFISLLFLPATEYSVSIIIPKGEIRDID